MIMFISANIGGWTSGAVEDVADLELEEAEDISHDRTIGPASPTTPHGMIKSQTKT